MNRNKYIITNKRTGKSEEVTQESFERIKSSINKRNFVFSEDAQDIGEPSPKAVTKKAKKADKED